MALSLQDENLVWQKVNKALGNQSGGPTTGTAANPVMQNGMRALKLQLATSKLAPQLQFVPFSYANITGASGYQPGIATAFHLYGFYVEKSGTGTTGTYFNIDDAASGSSASRREQAYLVNTLDQAMGLFPYGVSFSTDLTFSVTTTSSGTTESTGAGDVIQGFAIIGA